MNFASRKKVQAKISTFRKPMKERENSDDVMLGVVVVCFLCEGKLHYKLQQIESRVQL